MRRGKTLLKRSKSTKEGSEEGKVLLLPGRPLGLQPAEKPLGESSHEHVVVARRGEVVRIWPGKELGAESEQEQEHNPGRRRRRRARGRPERA